MSRPVSLVVLAVTALGGCATGGMSVPVPPPAGPVAVRELQSHVYPDTDPKALMKAVLGALQDDGFQVGTADADLGIITASRETVIPVSAAAKVGRWMLIAGTYGAAALFPGPKSSSTVLEATANVSEAGEESRLRVSFQWKVIDGSARVKEIHAVTDARFYQDFFARVDKGLFLAREKIS